MSHVVVEKVFFDCVPSRIGRRQSNPSFSLEDDWPRVPVCVRGAAVYQLSSISGCWALAPPVSCSLNDVPTTPNIHSILATCSFTLSGNPQEERARPRFERVGSRERTSPLGPRWRDKWIFWRTFILEATKSDKKLFLHTNNSNGYFANMKIYFRKTNLDFSL